jgi:hypothetical protein
MASKSRVTNEYLLEMNSEGNGRNVIEVPPCNFPGGPGEPVKNLKFRQQVSQPGFELYAFRKKV